MGKTTSAALQEALFRCTFQPVQPQNGFQSGGDDPNYLLLRIETAPKQENADKETTFQGHKVSLFDFTAMQFVNFMLGSFDESCSCGDPKAPPTRSPENGYADHPLFACMRVLAGAGLTSERLLGCLKKVKLYTVL